MSRITQSVALGVGAAGAMVDVSTYADLAAGSAQNWGRQSEFDDTNTRTFSFVLDNSDGRFTPDNPASPYATKVTEGMAVCWQLGTRLVAGTVRGIEPTFPNAESAWAQVRISCDDMLGSAARIQIDNLTGSAILGSTPILYWPFTDPAGSFQAIEASGNSSLPMVPYNEAFLSGTLQIYGVIPTFGVDPVPAVGLSQMNISAVAGSRAVQFGVGPLANPDLTFNKPFPTINYPSNDYGAWSVWVTPTNTTSTASIYFGPVNFSSFSMTPGGYYTATASGTNIVSTVSCAPNVPHLLQATVVNSGGNRLLSFYIDGVFIGNAAIVGNFTNATAQPAPPAISVGAVVGDTSINFSAFAHTQYLPALVFSGPARSTDRLALIASAARELGTPSFPSDFSSALLGNADVSGSALDAMNDVIRTEQGYIYTVTGGTLTSPLQAIVGRARNRPAAVSFTFNAENEADDAVGFVRDVTNLISAVTVDGPATSAYYKDATLIPRAGSANTSESALYRDQVDLLAWGQDRVNRGANTLLRVDSFTIDAFTTPTDRSADLLGMIPGDRIRITGLPSTQLGFSTYDGWFLGAEERHTLTTHKFTLYLQPVLPATAVFDTNRYMGGTDLTLSGAITNVATSMSVATVGAKITTAGGDFPFDMIIDSEQVTVTACTAATPQVATVTRGVNGTTAAAHSAGAQVELAVASLYAF